LLFTDPNRKQTLAPKTSPGRKTIIFFLLISAVAAVVLMRLDASLQGSDFPDFYCAARLLLSGQGHQLYDADLQRQNQARYAGRVGTLYIHPPFEAVVFLAVAWLPLRYAYRLWCLLNLVFLAGETRLLVKHLTPPWDWPVWFAACLTFVPVLLCLIQGQDSLLLLLLLVLAFVALRREHGFAAGCWLGLGLFKFQLVLPLILVLVLTRSAIVRSALMKGFGLVALALAVLSAVISGWSVFLVYPKFLVHLQAQPFAGVIPTAMANFRGLTYLALHRGRSHAAVAAMSVLSVAALIETLVGWKKQDNFDLAFANTLLFTLLVSYHLNPHDLTLLLLPMAVLLRAAGKSSVSRPGRWMTLTWLGILFLPPLHLWTLNTGVYALVSIPMLALFLNLGMVGREDKARPVS
jgi:hypothetical protein